MSPAATDAAGDEARCRLYLISPPDLGGDRLPAFADALVAALDAGDVACLQLRLKGPDESPVADDEIRRAIAALLPITREHDVAFVLNDRPDLAAELGCDGVHVGQDDASYDEARRAMGPDAIVGVTCHDSRHLALEAAEAGADYVAFGAFYDTGTKAPKSRAGRDILTWWSDVTEVPCVAIGGITTDNCAPLIAAGADFLAVSAGVWNHPDGPAAAVRAFNAASA
ncbi:MAG: thiamine phosphate synthase [Rhodospirillaceae bacterium]